jgi:hypothetical protein
VTHDPDDILRQVQAAEEAFAMLMQACRGPDTADKAASEVEAALFSSLLALGARLLELHFALRSAASEVSRRQDPAEPAPHSWRRVRYRSVFGTVPIQRAYVWSTDTGGRYPLDAELSLPARCYSDLLANWLEFAVSNDAYDQAVELIERILGQSIAKHALERLAADDAADVDAFYAQVPPPPASDEGPILVVQVDGKGVRLSQPGGERPTAKKEAIVTAVYTVEPHTANAVAIADKLAGLVMDPDDYPPPTLRPEPVAKRLRATLDGKDMAFQRLAHQVRLRDGPHIRHRLALMDGDTALQQRAQSYLGEDFTLILDIVHVGGYIRDAATARLGEAYPNLKDHIACRLYELLTGQLDRLLATLQEPPPDGRRLTAAEQETIDSAVGYLRNNAPYMEYATYLAHGWPIATGIAEGACGHLVKDRMERAGMKWTQPGAQAILDLRSVRVNDDWDAYQTFRRAQAHSRLYGSTPALPAPPELSLLAQAA